LRPRELLLQEVRSPKLHAEFAAYDPSNLGRIGPQACLSALQRHAESDHNGLDQETANAFWKGFVHDFHEIYKGVRLGDGNVDFSGFLELAKIVDTERAEFQHHSERRAAMLGGIPAHVEKQHFGELAHLRRFFVAHDAGETGAISAPRVLMALLESGVLPPVGDGFERAMRHFETFEESQHFKFADFLSYVTKHREEEVAVRRAVIQSALLNPKWECPVSRDDLPVLVVETGLFTDCAISVADVGQIVEDENKDGADSFDFQEMVELLGKVAETARSQGREREGEVGRHLGISADEIFEFRIQFAMLTGTGAIGPAEVRDILKEVNKEVDPDDVELDALIDEVLEQVSHVVMATAKKDSERPERMTSIRSAFGNRATLTGKSKLSFEGYLVLLGMLVSD